MVDGTGTTNYSYDTVNRMTSVTFPGSRTVGYSYSNAGNRATMTYPGGSNQVTYGYDEANNLTSVTDWNSKQTSYAYDNAGQLTTATLPSGTGIVGTLSYDNADRLTGISWVKGGSTTVASASYTLDAAGNRTQRVDQLGTHTYVYDALYRLTSVSYPGPTTDTYSYDAVGNRTAKNSTTYTYDAANRITAAGSTSYTYDNNGDLTARGSDSFSWDAADRLTSATVSSTATTFAYNGDGLRDSLTTGGNTMTSTWDINAGLAQELYDGSLSYVYGIGRIAQIDGSGNTYYYLPDALGSTMALCDASGTVVNSYNYDAFGAIRSSSGSQANPFTFTGEQTDASTGLEYLRARYYDSASGIFISRDPCPASTASPTATAIPSATWIRPVCAHRATRLPTRARARCIQQAYDEVLGKLDAKSCAGSEGGAGGSDGLHCKWTTDCSEGHGCDGSVVDKQKSDPHPDSCWHDDEQPNRIPRWAVEPPVHAKNCGGLLGKVGCALTSDCGSFGVSLVETAMSLNPSLALTTTAISAAYATYDAGTGNVANGVVDFQGEVGNAAAGWGNLLKSNPLLRASVVASVISDAYYGTKCLGIF